MILKASQRGGGQDLAAHLMKLNDNEHIALHELRGFASNNLKDAFKESEAISRGTNCRQYLFSLSLNPPQQEQVPVELFEETINRIEDRLGLQGQPRAIVFHASAAPRSVRRLLSICLTIRNSRSISHLAASISAVNAPKTYGKIALSFSRCSVVSALK